MYSYYDRDSNASSLTNWSLAFDSKFFNSCSHNVWSSLTEGSDKKIKKIKPVLQEKESTLISNVWNLTRQNSDFWGLINKKTQKQKQKFNNCPSKFIYNFCKNI